MTSADLSTCIFLSVNTSPRGYAIARRWKRVQGLSIHADRERRDELEHSFENDPMEDGSKKQIHEACADLLIHRKLKR